MSSRDEYIRKLQNQLDKWNAQIDKLVVQAALAKAEARVEYHEEITALREKRDELLGRLAELQRAGEGAWEGVKSGFELAWNVVEDAFESARKRFRD